MTRPIARRALMQAAALMGAWTLIGGSAVAAAGRTRGSPRVRKLLTEMTVEEKVGQLTTMPAAVAGAAAAFNPQQAPKELDAQLAEVRAGRLGSVFNIGNAAVIRQLQEAAVQGSRLKIPMLFGADLIHGFKTIFPVPLAEAASFDPELCERTARAAAVEATSVGLDWTFAPMVDIARDARWGRVVEGAGEDVLLGRLLAAARVRGFQGKSLADRDAMVACPKHFVAYGAAEGGVDYNSVDVSERTLREVYLPPFKAGFGAGALTTMAAFNEVNGVPASANPHLLDQILRREWHFEGLVVSDFNSDNELINHGYAADEREAARLAFMAGVDMSMASGLYNKHLPGLIASRDVPMERLNEAVARVLTVKERLGLFDEPFLRIDNARKPSPVGRADMLELSREAGRKSIVLVKNDGDLLPLSSSGRKIALIGPFADGKHDMNGPWSLFGENAASVTLAEGVRAALTDPSLLTVVEGCKPLRAIDGGIAEAVAAAQAADVVLLAIGETELMSGEAHSRADIVIPAAQMALAEAVAAAGKPMVVLLRNGRPLVIEGAVLAARSILVTWFLGSQTGHSVADIIFGRAAPTGRLPVSFPRASGQTPYYYAHKSTGRQNPRDHVRPFSTRYIGLLYSALFPFGHGLTYGKMEYGSLVVESGPLRRGGRITISATVTNHGARAADELVQLYVQDVVGSITRPIRELKAFRRVSVAPGASEQVRFTLPADDLGFLGNDLRPRLENGRFNVWIAPSAEAEGAPGSFDLVA